MEDGIGTPICELRVSRIASGKNKGWFRVHTSGRERPFSANTLNAALTLCHPSIMSALGGANTAKTGTARTPAASAPAAKARGRTRKPAMAGT